jgi:chaperonin GroES
MAKINIKPTPGYLLVEPAEAETKTSSGIYLPDNAGEKPKKANVLAVGADLLRDGQKIVSPVKVGDVIFYKKSWDNDIKVSGKEYLFVKFEEVMGIES